MKKKWKNFILTFISLCHAHSHRCRLPVGLLRATVAVIQRSGGVHGGHIRKKDRTVRGMAAAAQHLLVAVGGEPQVLEELLQVAGGELGGAPVAVANIRLQIFNA